MHVRAHPKHLHMSVPARVVMQPHEHPRPLLPPTFSFPSVLNVTLSAGLSLHFSPLNALKEVLLCGSLTRSPPCRNKATQQ